MRIAAAVILCGLSAATLQQAASAYGWEETALDRYIAALDLNYHYQLLNTVVADTHTAYLLEVTSQQWRTAEKVDRPIWKHWLMIVRLVPGCKSQRMRFRPFPHTRESGHQSPRE